MEPSSSSSTTVKHAKRGVQVSLRRRRTVLSATHANGWLPSGFVKGGRNVRDDGTRTPVNKALLIGIQYEGNDAQSKLTAAHNDVQLVKKMLIELYGFEEANIVVLLDSADRKYAWPTQDNILEAIDKLMHGVQKGDTLYFHYSGHGEQVPCAPGDTSEDDGKDEAIVPCDATDDAKTWILDNTLNDKLVKQLPVGAYLFAVFDMCHSGTALDLNNYDYPCNNLLKKYTRKVTAGVRKMSLALTRRSSRTASEARRLPQMTGKTTLNQTPDRCVVITSERLSLAKVKSRKLSVDVQQPTVAPPMDDPEDGLTPVRRYTLSKSEKAYVLQYQSEKSPATGSVPVISNGIYEGMTVDDRRHSSHTLVPQHLSTILESTTEIDSHLQAPHQPYPTSDIKRARSPFSLVWLLARKLVGKLRRLRKANKGSSRKKKGEWNVFSSEGLSKRKESIRKPIIRKDTCADNNMSEKQGSSTTFLPSGIVFESPPCSPSTPQGFTFSPRRSSSPSSSAPQTGQVVSIAAATDAQLAMEYMDKDNQMKSLTAILVEVLYQNPHPTIGNLMSDLSKWLHSSSKEMHRYFEQRKARYEAKAKNPKLLSPRTPKNTQEKEWVKQEDEMQEMVLRTRPVQQPVVGTQLKINLDKESILPLLSTGE